MRNFERLMQKMSKAAQPFSECQAKFLRIKELDAFSFSDVEDSLHTLRLLGVPLVELQQGMIALETTFTPFEKQRFCIVDIETNGSKPNHAQIIEIGAIMMQNGTEIDRFETFVYAQEIPENIQELTQIQPSDVKDAPSIKSVLEKFRLFLGDAVFVAHNVNFDYGFISYWMEQIGYGPLLNRKLCTIDLARKCLEAPRYGLSTLIKHLGLQMEQHHRALSDAKAASDIFELCLQKLPAQVISTEDLLFFAKPNQKSKKKKKETKKRQPKLPLDEGQTES